MTAFFSTPSPLQSMSSLYTITFVLHHEYRLPMSQMIEMCVNGNVSDDNGTNDDQDAWPNIQLLACIMVKYINECLPNDTHNIIHHKNWLSLAIYSWCCSSKFDTNWCFAYAGHMLPNLPHCYGKRDVISRPNPHSHIIMHDNMHPHASDLTYDIQLV